MILWNFGQKHGRKTPGNQKNAGKPALLIRIKTFESAKVTRETLGRHEKE